jgi:hypothetical protein
MDEVTGSSPVAPTSSSLTGSHPIPAVTEAACASALSTPAWPCVVSGARSCVAGIVATRGRDGLARGRAGAGVVGLQVELGRDQGQGPSHPARTWVRNHSTRSLACWALRRSNGRGQGLPAICDDSLKLDPRDRPGVAPPGGTRARGRRRNGQRGQIDRLIVRGTTRTNRQCSERHSDIRVRGPRVTNPA